MLKYLGYETLSPVGACYQVAHLSFELINAYGEGSNKLLRLVVLEKQIRDAGFAVPFFNDIAEPGLEVF